MLCIKRHVPGVSGWKMRSFGAGLQCFYVISETSVISWGQVRLYHYEIIFNKFY